MLLNLILSRTGVSYSRCNMKSPVKLIVYNSCRSYGFNMSVGSSVKNLVTPNSTHRWQLSIMQLFYRNNTISNVNKSYICRSCINQAKTRQTFRGAFTSRQYSSYSGQKLCGNSVSNSLPIKLSDLSTDRVRFVYRKLQLNCKRYYSTGVKSEKSVSGTKNGGGYVKEIEKIYSNRARNGFNDNALAGVKQTDIISNTREMKRLFQLAKSEKWKLTGAIFLLLVSSCITMAVPFSLGKVIDLIYTTNADQMQRNLNMLSAILLSVFLVGGFCNFGRVYLMNVCGHKITRDLRQKVFLSIMKQEVAFFDKNKTGELINRLSADTALVGNCITTNISDGLRSAVMAVAGVSMMFYVSPQLACVGLAIVPPVAGAAVVYGRYVRNVTKAVQDALAESTQVAEERIGNVRTVKAFSHEQIEIETYNQRMQRVFDLSVKESLARGCFFGLTGLSGNVIILVVLYYGVSLVGQNQFTVGSLSAFLFYAAYVGISLSGLSSFYAELNKGLGASTRLWELIDREPAIPVTGGLVPVKHLDGDITFKNVFFSYPSRPESQILKDLSLCIRSGSVTAVVGQSGSGKSTLASLIIRLYDPLRGHVAIDGLPVSVYNPGWLRSHIGTVNQEPVLFSGTIRENIAYGADNPNSVKIEQIEMAAAEANAYDFITRSFPEGFETRVGERGIMLSGGQKQRVAIARALVKNPRILLLDEATSALDAESEHLVQEALERIMRGRTVLTIAHRLSTIKNADQIAVLKDGAVVELGTYDQLMLNKSGAFRKLVQHQAFGSIGQSIPKSSIDSSFIGLQQITSDQEL